MPFFRLRKFHHHVQWIRDLLKPPLLTRRHLNMSTLGICDWGIGGLGFYRLLAAQRPDLDVVYIGDQGAIPYGKMRNEALAARLSVVMQMFGTLDVKRVVVACNAAGTVLAQVHVPGLCATSVIAPTLRRLRRENYACVGIIGGRRTVQSQAYAAPLRHRGVRVQQRVAQPLSALIEAGQADASETLALLRTIIAPLHTVDCLILGCTHYSVLTPALHILLPAIPLIDPTVETWREISQELPPPQRCRGNHRFYTTGDPAAMQTQAAAVFGVYTDVRCL